MTKAPRISRTPADWQAILNEQSTSGLSIKNYCETNQITASNFYAARSKFGNGTRSLPQTETADWVSFSKFTAPTNAAPLQQWKFELELPGGITLRMQTSP